MPLSSTTRTLAIVAAVVLGGCSFSPEKKGGFGGNTGYGGHPDLQGIGGSGNLGTGGTGNEASLDGSNCGVLDRPLVMLPPDVLIVLDRSGSMDNDIDDKGCSGDGGVGTGTGNCGANSKWGIMTPAIKSVVTATETDVNWGLKFFANPGDSNCGVNTMAAVNIAMMNATAVNNAITMQTNTAGGISGGSRTPTRAAISNAVTYLRSVTEPNPKFILLATDGLPNCPAQGGNTGADDSPAAIQAVKDAYTAGIPTFVVGIATGGMGTADATLTSMAMAGGYPQPGTPAYFSVDSQQALVDALNKIVTQVGGSCLFALGPTPTNNGTTSHDKISVFADGTQINHDPAQGWEFSDPSHNAITLNGQLCQDVMSGAVKNVNVVYQCIVP
jgi:hypothetical protein